MTRIGIVGVGAIGGTLAVSLHRAGHRPFLATRQPFVRLSGSLGETEVGFDDLSLWRQPDQVMPVDVLFVATKAHQTEGAAAWIRPATQRSSVVVVVQNGVEQEARVRPHTEAAEVLPGIIDLPARRTAPGAVALRRGGRLTLPATEAGRRVCQLFSPDDPWLEARPDPELELVRWRKLCVNVISGAIPTLADRPTAVFRDPDVQALCRHLISEVVHVAAAEGIELPTDVADVIIRGFASAPPDGLNSMLRDRRNGRLLEGDARHGAVVRIGARHDIATPYNHFAQVMLSAINA